MLFSFHTYKTYRLLYQGCSHVMLVFRINQTLSLLAVGGSFAREQWPVVKQAQQTLKKTPEIGFTLETARYLCCIEKATFYTHDDNTEVFMDV